MSKILLVVEGDKDEPRILGDQSRGLLSLMGTEYEVVPFSNPIYELYDAYIKGEYDDLVAYLVAEKGLKLKEGVLPKNAFSAVYLVFDFEPQYQKYSDEKIRKLLELFDDETKLGKLYINYPMLESYYHLKNLPDREYNNRVVSLDNLTGKIYKKLVHEETCLKSNKIGRRELCQIIFHNYYKSKFILKTGDKYIDYGALLENQLSRKNKNNEIYVLSTFPVLVVDYNYERAMEVISRELRGCNIE